MRSDEANRILGLRVNVWMSALVFLLGVGLFWRFGTSSERTVRAKAESQHPG